jgi:hypothetical protein
MVGAEDLGQGGPGGDQRGEDPVAGSDVILLQDVRDGVRFEQVGKGELGRVAKGLDLVVDPTACTLGHGWPAWR